MSLPIIGRYVLSSETDHGPVSRIFSARVAGTGAESQVLLELFHKDLGDEIVNQLEQEARATLPAMHRNLLAQRDFGRADKAFFVARDYFRARSLASLLGRSPPDLETICSVALQILDALQAAQHYIDPVTGVARPQYRASLTPFDILISAEGELKVAGFATEGAGRKRPSPLDLQAFRLPYLPFDALDGEGGPGSDLYSLGVIFWESLTGLPLVPRAAPEEMVAVIRAGIKNLPGASNFPGGIVEATQRLLTSDRAHRFAGAEEAKFAFQKALFGADLRADERRVAAWASPSFTDEVFQPAPEIKALGTEHTLAGLSMTEGLTREFTKESRVWMHTPARSFPPAQEGSESQSARVPIATPEAPEKPAQPAPLMIGDLEPTVRTEISRAEVPAPTEPTKLVELRTSPRATVTPTEASRARPKPPSTKRGKQKAGPRAILIAGAVMVAGMAIWISIWKGESTSPRNNLPPAEPAVVSQALPEPTPHEPARPQEEEETGSVAFRTEVRPTRVLVDGVEASLQGDFVKIPLNKLVQLRISAPGYRDLTIKLRARSTEPLRVPLSFEKSP